MQRVQIHCYGCDATVPVATDRSAEDLSRAGWSLLHGETYCRKCSPAPVSTPAGPAAEGSDTAPSAEPPAGLERTHRWPAPAGVFTSVASRVKWPRLGRTGADGDERRAAHSWPAAVALRSTFQLPFRKAHAPVTSHSKVTSQTIALFCIAVVLTLATLGSNDFAVRLPGVVFAFAAGLSWLHDLRQRS
jgi:hypothetical protein